MLHTPLAIAYAASTVQVQGIVQCAQLYNVSSILQSPKQADSMFCISQSPNLLLLRQC